MERLARARLDTAVRLILLVAFLPPARAMAAPGALDPSFGTGGMVVAPIGGDDDEARAAVLQPDGKVVVAGWTHNGVDRDVLLARYDATGLPDPGFGTGGTVVTDLGLGDDVAQAIVLSAGRLIVTGSTVTGGGTSILLLAYDLNGVPDPGFGTGGVTQTSITGDDEALALIVDHEGQLVAAGRAGSAIAVVRYSAAGVPDPTFDDDGIRTTTAGTAAAATALVELANDHVVIAGWAETGSDRDAVLARYRPNGAPFAGFGSGGVVTVSLGGDDVAEALVRGGGNRLVVAGWSEDVSGTDVVLLGYGENGDPDVTFGSGGTVRTSIGTDARATALARDSDGKLLAAGSASLGGSAELAVLRYLADGGLDPDFGTGGVVTTPIGTGDAGAEAVALLPDRRVVVAGRAMATDDDVVLARYFGRPDCGNGLTEPGLGEDCDDGNRANGDCCSATCLHEPAGARCADDGDPCSDDRCDGAGACAHPPAAGACDDHVCYRARNEATPSATSLALTDAFADVSGVVRRPQGLCPAASVEGGAVDDAGLYLERYRLRAMPRRRRQELRITDRFGTHLLRPVGADRFLVPTRVATGAPTPGPPAPGSGDALTCYRVRATQGGFPSGIQVLAADALGSRVYDVVGPRRVCLAADVNGTGTTNPLGDVICHRVRAATGGPPQEPVADLQTANMLATGELTSGRPDELCVRALRDPCGALPPCVPLGGQNADCTYDPVVAEPAHAFCAGPTVRLDVAHDNFHVIERANDGLAGRYWGFAKLLLSDGYDVRQTVEDTQTVVAEPGLGVHVIANPQTENPAANAIHAGELRALVDWVRAGGALLLVIDHPPFERVDALLAAVGLERLGVVVSRHLFTRTSGELNGAAEVANGPGPATEVDSVETFTGTAFAIADDPPADAQLEPVLILPNGTLQGVAIEFGAGRVFVAGEAASLSAQLQGDGELMGMNAHPENERYLRNIFWWLTQ